jgi:hypothetical protein
MRAFPFKSGVYKRNFIVARKLLEFSIGNGIETKAEGLLVRDEPAWGISHLWQVA